MYQGVMIHHSDSIDTDHANIVDIERWHLDRGFSGIGYHWVIEKDRERYVAVMGRPMIRPGAHSRGQNERYIGVCLVGKFNDSAPPAGMLPVAADLVASLLKLLGPIADPHDPVVYHREFAATDCPGHKFPFDLFRKMVSDRRKK